MDKWKERASEEDRGWIAKAKEGAVMAAGGAAALVAFGILAALGASRFWGLRHERLADRKGWDMRGLLSQPKRCEKLFEKMGERFARSPGPAERWTHAQLRESREWVAIHYGLALAGEDPRRIDAAGSAMATPCAIHELRARLELLREVMGALAEWRGKPLVSPRMGQPEGRAPDPYEGVGVERTARRMSEVVAVGWAKAWSGAWEEASEDKKGRESLRQMAYALAACVKGSTHGDGEGRWAAFVEALPAAVLARLAEAGRDGLLESVDGLGLGVGLVHARIERAELEGAARAESKARSKPLRM